MKRSRKIWPGKRSNICSLKLTRTDEVFELADKNIKTDTTTVFHTFKNVSRSVEGIEKQIELLDVKITVYKMQNMLEGPVAD